MSRSRTILIAALNIAMHKPHSPKRYVEMFFDAYKLGAKVKLSNVHYSVLGSAYQENPDDALDPINGEIWRFVKIDPNETWFNTSTKDVATESELREVSIPDHLLAHMQRIPYVFHPKTHRLYFITKDGKTSMGAGTLKKILNNILGRLVAEKRYPEIEVTVVPEAESVERILSMPYLQKLHIELVRPNADDGVDEERRFMEKMANERAKKYTQSLISERNGSLAPDEQTKSLARMAAHNGKVVGEGRDATGGKLIESTTQSPMIQSALVDPNIESTRNVLTRTATHLDAA
ncbi:MAG: hypothetical protein H6R04_711 [Burkholderiaceae bacterium]|nr:hypothetical protein [Burkholderiaceae bacterium]